MTFRQERDDSGDYCCGSLLYATACFHARGVGAEGIAIENYDAGCRTF
jgi:hypothetical protein